MFEKPKHADHIDDEQEKRRRKWAEFITKNPDAFYAALKGISVASHKAEIADALEKDFAPDDLTPEDQERLQNLEELMPALREEGQKSDIAGENKQELYVDEKGGHYIKHIDKYQEEDRPEISLTPITNEEYTEILDDQKKTFGDNIQNIRDKYYPEIDDRGRIVIQSNNLSQDEIKEHNKGRQEYIDDKSVSKREEGDKTPEKDSDSNQSAGKLILPSSQKEKDSEHEEIDEKESLKGQEKAQDMDEREGEDKTQGKARNQPLGKIILPSSKKNKEADRGGKAENKDKGQGKEREEEHER